MMAGKIELGGHACLGLACADKPCVGAHSQRQAKTVEQDRLPRPRLAREHAKTRFEL